MRFIEHFIQPRIVREAERVLRNEAANVRIETHLGKHGVMIFYNQYGQLSMETLDKMLEQPKDENES